MMTATKPSRYAHIDALRGVACLAVLYNHAGTQVATHFADAGVGGRPLRWAANWFRPNPHKALLRSEMLTLFAADGVYLNAAMVSMAQGRVRLAWVATVRGAICQR